MSPAYFRREIARCRRRTGRALGASVVFHALLLLWLIFLPRAAVSQAPITEIMSAPVEIVSVGPEREQTVRVDRPFRVASLPQGPEHVEGEKT